MTDQTASAPSPVDSEPGRIVLAQVMLPTDANAQGNVHGGTLMKLADTAGAIAAMRHAGRRVVTAMMDSMTFQKRREVVSWRWHPSRRRSWGT